MMWRALACVFALTLSQPAYSQDIETDDESDESRAEEEQVMDEIVVTGSRIRRDEFTSASPVQIIDGQASRELGLIDTAALLQSATQ